MNIFCQQVSCRRFRSFHGMRFPIASPVTSLRSLSHKIKESSSRGKWNEAFSHYQEIKRTGLREIDHTIFSHVLKECIVSSFELGESVHASVIKHGFESFGSVGNSVMDFYAKSGALCSALRFFDYMHSKDSVSWNIILHGHFCQNIFGEGVNLFTHARADGFEPNISTLVLMIHSFRNLRAYNDGQKFHGYLIKSGLVILSSVLNSLLGLYTDIEMDYAQNLFDDMSERDVISWSVMISGYERFDYNLIALESFKKMVSEFGVEPDGLTMVSVLKCCINLGDIRIGKVIQCFIFLRGLNYDMFVGNTLVDLYGKCGDLDSAILAFQEIRDKNTVSWNSLLSGLVRNGNNEEAFALLASMKQSGVDFDGVTLVNLLLLCKVLADIRHCKLIHSRIIRRGLESNELAMNSLIDTYAKCDQISYSWRIFFQIKRPDIVTWSTMIAAFTQCGFPDEAISLYREMRVSHENPNSVTMLNLLEACGISADLKRSKCAHGIAFRMGLASLVEIGTAVLDMYAKCGFIEASRRAFDHILVKNVVSWSAMIAAYGLNGLPHKALALFSEMKALGVEANAVTALSVLSACCHGGLIEEGLSFFEDLVRKNRVELKLEHYSCLVDLLARSGHVDDAFKLIKSAPIDLGGSAWGAVLSACRTYEDRRLIEGVLLRVLELEPLSSSGYLLASNTYAVGGSWRDAFGMRCLMKEKGVQVVAGYSLVYVSDQAYTFTAGDKYRSLDLISCPVIEQLHSCMRIDMGSGAMV